MNMLPRLKFAPKEVAHDNTVFKAPLRLCLEHAIAAIERSFPRTSSKQCCWTRIAVGAKTLVVQATVRMHSLCARTTIDRALRSGVADPERRAEFSPSFAFSPSCPVASTHSARDRIGRAISAGTFLFFKLWSFKRGEIRVCLESPPPRVVETAHSPSDDLPPVAARDMTCNRPRRNIDMHRELNLLVSWPWALTRRRAVFVAVIVPLN